MGHGWGQWRVVTGLFLALFFMPCQADSLRCGSRLVQVGDNKLDVIDKCGQPVYSEVVSGSDERVVEVWFYRRGRESLTRILTFRGTRLVDIKTDTRR